MSTRSIINADLQVIGELSEPPGVTWTEAQWKEKLDAFKVPPPQAPIANISPAQLVLALDSYGISETMIEEYIDQIPDAAIKKAALVKWQRATYFERSNPLVGQVASMLGWTSDQLDDLWKLAATL